jgi:activating signal cointegrator 1
MKAITVYQPWASLIAIEAKQYETRSWKTNYRGMIAIHAALKPFDTRSWLDRELHSFAEALKLSDIYSFDKLPYGCIVATAELVECYMMYDNIDNGIYIARTQPIKHEGDYPFTEIEKISEREQYFGDWREGRYAWEFGNMTQLPKPIPAKGKQGLWNWEQIQKKEL